MYKALDLAIQKQEDVLGGYVIRDKSYSNYMANAIWEIFLQDMKDNYPNAYNSYKNGGGSELKEGRYPPKMACFGSSSRFIYNLSKDIPGFQFEKQFHTHVGGKSNLDGFFDSIDCCTCIEAKCREPYYRTSHFGEKRKNVYYNLLKFITDQNIGLQFDCTETEDNEISIKTYSNDLPIKYFDIIQLVCHFCGIANKLLRNEINKNVRFIYLIYNPTKLPEACFKKGMKEKIVNRYDLTLNQMNSIDMNELFKTILNYFDPEKKTQYNFKFIKSDQNDFIDLLNK